MNRNHKQDSFDGGRAASLTTNPATTNALDRRPTHSEAEEELAEAEEELALALAMLALSESGDLGE